MNTNEKQHELNLNVENSGEVKRITKRPVKDACGNYYFGEIDEKGRKHGIGRINFSDGTKAEGTFKNGQMDGEITYIYSQKERLVYLFKGGCEICLLKAYFEKGDYFEGTPLKNNMGLTEGRFVYANGRVCIGIFKYYKPIGDVEVVNSIGDCYRGPIKNGIFSGKGRIIYKTANEEYVGDFYNDLRNGNGIHQFSDKSTYQGNWWNDNMHGNGTQIFEDGTEFKGSFYLNQRRKGILRKPDDTTIEGSFYGDTIIGQVKIIFPTGEIYEGDYYNDSMNGFGTYKFVNGDIYTGGFKEGKFFSRGEYSYSNGAKYIGPFENSKFEGAGIIVFPNAQCYFGMFKNGEARDFNGELKNMDSYVREYANWVDNQLVIQDKFREIDIPEFDEKIKEIIKNDKKNRKECLAK